MKRSAFLINTSRGGTVDADALLAALREKRIAGAGVDCTDPEPLPDDSPFYDLENIVISPHISGGADNMMEMLGTASATQALRVLRGQSSSRVLNPEVLPALRQRQRTASTIGAGEAPETMKFRVQMPGMSLYPGTGRHWWERITPGGPRDRAGDRSARI